MATNLNMIAIGKHLFDAVLWDATQIYQQQLEARPPPYYIYTHCTRHHVLYLFIRVTVGSFI
jgi:hypothetical protein